MLHPEIWIRVWKELNEDYCWCKQRWVSAALQVQRLLVWEVKVDVVADNRLRSVSNKHFYIAEQRVQSRRETRSQGAHQSPVIPADVVVESLLGVIGCSPGIVLPDNERRWLWRKIKVKNSDVATASVKVREACCFENRPTGGYLRLPWIWSAQQLVQDNVSLSGLQCR